MARIESENIHLDRIDLGVALNAPKGLIFRGSPFRDGGRHHFVEVPLNGAEPVVDLNKPENLNSMTAQIDGERVAVEYDPQGVATTVEIDYTNGQVRNVGAKVSGVPVRRT